ncbi:hypothetical protein ACFYKX_11150 [Cytobacillus sp. FJAT-54145]|uniref:SWIM-type domain-containing protein n=1 Tax=Cytobacillus spartinae TaxID=3299023 RepID=A0ABW6KA94_9BACI
MPKSPKVEVLATMCAFSGTSEEVAVKKNDCPIQRLVGFYVHKDLVTGEPEQRCTCILTSSRGILVPRCPHYKGVKEVQRNKKRVYKVFCEAVEQPKENG